MYIVHYGELALKGKNRGSFEMRLKHNIEEKLKSIPGLKVQKKYGKFVVKIPEDSLVSSDDKKIEEVLESTPGISYFAKAEKVALDMDEIKKSLDGFFPNDFQTFKVVTKRTNKSFPMKSPDISMELGKYISEKYDMPADYKNPEIVFFVNIAEQEAYVYSSKNYGVGGMPVGSAGKIVSLLSGGIDSPVASYLMMKRGAKVFALHAYAKSLNPEKVKEKVLALSRQLSKYQGKFVLYLFPYEKIQREIVQGVDEKYRMLLFKRSIVRLANRLARKIGARAISMGDSLGQVASQTMENIDCVYSASDLPVFSPLIAYDKQEIVNLSKKIGTYEISILPHDDCCSLITGEHPWTKGKKSVLEEMEEEIMISVVEDQVWEEVEKFTIKN